MVTLFDDDPDYPDHRPVPSPFGGITSHRLCALVLFALPARDLCPLVLATADPPYEDHSPVPRRVQVVAVSTASANNVVHQIADTDAQAVHGAYLRLMRQSSTTANEDDASILTLL